MKHIFSKNSLMVSGDPVLVFVPLCHVFGLHCILTASLIKGLKVILMSKFTPEHFLLLIQEYKVIHANVVIRIELLFTLVLLNKLRCHAHY